MNEPIAALLKERVDELAVEFGPEVSKMEVMPDHAHWLGAVAPQFGIAK